MSDETSAEGSAQFRALVELSAGLGLIAHPNAGALHRAEIQQQVLQRVYHPEMPGSVRELLGRIRFIASTVRDRFSGDTWRILGRLEVDARSRPGRLPLANAATLVQNLVLDLAAFNGMEMENMTRGHGWRFLDLGRRMERGQAMVQLLRVTAELREGISLVLEPVLEIADSLMTYRRRYYAEPSLAGVTDLLLRDSSNPRGLAFQIDSLAEHIAALPTPLGASGVPVSASITEVMRLRQRLRELGDDHEIDGTVDSLRNLIRHLDFFGVELATISDSITGRYFSHTVPRVS